MFVNVAELISVLVILLRLESAILPKKIYADRSEAEPYVAESTSVIVSVAESTSVFVILYSERISKLDPR